MAEIKDYKPNSKAYKEKIKKGEEPKRTKKIVQNPVTIDKKAGIKNRFSKAMLADDISNIGSYIVFDVIIPSVKSALSEIVKSGIDIALFGSTKKNNNNSQYVSYSSYSTRFGNGNAVNVTPKTNINQYDFDNVQFATRSDAQNVLNAMIAIIDQYGVVSVADFYDMLGKTTPWTANDFGWDNLSTASIRPSRGAWIILLPDVKDIGR